MQFWRAVNKYVFEIFMNFDNRNSFVDFIKFGYVLPIMNNTKRVWFIFFFSNFSRPHLALHKYEMLKYKTGFHTCLTNFSTLNLWGAYIFF